MFDAESATPTEILAEVLRRLEAEDWDGAVSLHTPGYVRSAAGDALRFVRPRRRAPTVEGLLASDPSMPREVAEYEVERARRRPPPSPYFGDLYGVESEADLEPLSPADIFARLLQGRDYRWRWREHLTSLMERHPMHREALREQLDRAGSPWRRNVVGHVLDGQKAYVIFDTRDRPPEEYQEDHPPRVAVLRRTRTGWRVSSDIMPPSGTMFGEVRVPDGAGGWISLG